ncbi:MAG: hypothetical protein HY455_02280 [Parcubacteria group bacterium]|nr:hypothetical protein [Parcubacteria group bacterium]
MTGLISLFWLFVYWIVATFVMLAAVAVYVLIIKDSDVGEIKRELMHKFTWAVCISGGFILAIVAKFTM